MAFHSFRDSLFLAKERQQSPHLANGSHTSRLNFRDLYINVTNALEVNDIHLRSPHEAKASLYIHCRRMGIKNPLFYNIGRYKIPRSSTSFSSRNRTLSTVLVADASSSFEEQESCWTRSFESLFPVHRSALLREDCETNEEQESAQC